MRNSRVWRRALGVDHRVVIEGVDYDDDLDEITVRCRLRSRAKPRCGRCGRRSPLYDRGDGRRRWRSLDAGTTRVFIDAEAPRVDCTGCGVTVAAVPWARHDARHTRAFDDQVAWLVTHTSKSAVVELMRVAWRTVGAIAGQMDHIDGNIAAFGPHLYGEGICAPPVEVAADASRQDRLLGALGRDPAVQRVAARQLAPGRRARRPGGSAAYHAGP